MQSRIVCNQEYLVTPCYETSSISSSFESHDERKGKNEKITIQKREKWENNEIEKGKMGKITREKREKWENKQREMGKLGK